MKMKDRLDSIKIHVNTLLICMIKYAPLILDRCVCCGLAIQKVHLSQLDSINKLHTIIYLHVQIWGNLIILQTIRHGPCDWPQSSMQPMLDKGHE